jgi:hypothetical protein
MGRPGEEENSWKAVDAINALVSGRCENAFQLTPDPRPTMSFKQTIEISFKL